MKNGMVIIDADGHASDFEPQYRKHLPESMKKRSAIFTGGDGFDRRQNGAIPWRAESPEAQLADMDVEGIDLSVLYPSGGLSYTRIRERDLAVAMARAYNDHLHEWCSANPKRLRGMAILPLHVDVKEALKELDRAVGRLGMVGVVVHTFFRHHHVAHEDFWPVYEECNRQGIPVAFHGNGSDEMDAVSHFDNFLWTHTFSHAPDQLMAATAVIYSGLLEAYPDLKVAFLEAGAGWVPFWMEHMDGEWARRKFDAPRLTAPPSEYFKSGRVYVSCEPEEKTLPYVAQWIGEDQIVFPSDYPHWDGEWPEAVDELLKRKDVSETLKRKIFRDNPERFYNFKVDASDPGSLARPLSVKA